MQFMELIMIYDFMHALRSRGSTTPKLTIFLGIQYFSIIYLLHEQNLKHNKYSV
jgi:hypothetical protein